MGYLRSVLIGMGVLTMVISFSSLAFSEMGHGDCMGHKAEKGSVAAQIKVLRDSATSLQMSNPMLANRLNDLADKKTEKMKKWQEWKAQHDENMNLLKDSAAALQTSNPALARELQKMHEKNRSMGKKEIDEEMER